MAQSLDFDPIARAGELWEQQWAADPPDVHSAKGELPLSKIGERLQVHATSVTNVVDRLEAAGLVRREPNPRDGRGTLAVITEPGRRVANDATATLNEARFGLAALPAKDTQSLFEILRSLRVDAGDFVDDGTNGN